jgi:hypothetical protein
MSGRQDTRIAVVGAGVAGLAAARTLAEAGRAVRVIEKSRGPGGRAATRRRGGPAFDHGAPCFAVSGPAFAREVERWIAAGAAAHWPEAPGGPAVVGLPGTSGIAAPLAEGLDIAVGLRAEALAGRPGAWRLGLEGGGEAGPFAAMLLAIPAPQAADLLGARAEAFPALGRARMSPCWTAMAAFGEPLSPDPSVEGDGAPLALAIREGAKPGRAAAPERWVLHAGADWSAANLEADREAAGAALLDAFAARLGRTLPPTGTLMVHRWRYARAAAPAGADCLWDPALGIGLAGDWCPGGGVEAAWTSGRALAARLLEG